MSKKLDQTGRAAQLLQADLNKYTDRRKSYDERRREVTERLRPMLQKIWAALEAGETVNGFTSKEDWAHWYNPAAKNGKTASRQIQRIVNPKEATSCRPKSLKPGSLFKIDGVTCRVPADILEHQTSVAFLKPEAYTKGDKAAGRPRWATLTMIVEYVEDEVVKTENRKRREKLEQTPAATAPDEEHTGQHEDCVECFEAYQAEEAQKAKRDAANEQWRKRVQTLINTWRSHRLKDEDKYRAEFDKASAKYEKKVGDKAHTDSIINEARGRMEGAIADLKRFEKKFHTDEEPLSEPAAALEKTLNKLVEGAVGTKLRAEAANAAYGDKKVSKKVYERILAALEKYQSYWRTQMPPIPERPENAIVKTQNDLTGNGCHMIAETSPEYDAWEAASAAAQRTPEYKVWEKERRMMVELQSALIQRYDPLMEGDVDGDNECEGVAAD